MTKPATTRLITIAFLGLVGAVVVARQAGWGVDYGGTASGFGSSGNSEADPRDTIYRMLDAARDGDVEAYLSCYAGELESRLRQSRNETTTEGFSAYLRERNHAIKGIAVSEPAAVSSKKVRVRVEYVYADRNEAQQLYLENQGDGWKISGVSAAVHVETPVPYGTPVD